MTQNIIEKRIYDIINNGYDNAAIKGSYQANLKLWERGNHSRTYIKIYGSENGQRVSYDFGYLNNKTGEYVPADYDLADETTCFGCSITEWWQAEDWDYTDAEVIKIKMIVRAKYQFLNSIYFDDVQRRHHQAAIKFAQKTSADDLYARFGDKINDDNPMDALTAFIKMAKENAEDIIDAYGASHANVAKNLADGRMYAVMEYRKEDAEFNPYCEIKPIKYPGYWGNICEPAQRDYGKWHTVLEPEYNDCKICLVDDVKAFVDYLNSDVDDPYWYGAKIISGDVYNRFYDYAISR